MFSAPECTDAHKLLCHPLFYRVDSQLIGCISYINILAMLGELLCFHRSKNIHQHHLRLGFGRRVHCEVTLDSLLLEHLLTSVVLGQQFSRPAETDTQTDPRPSV